MEGQESKRYRLTIYYVGPDGETVAPTRRKSCIEGLLIAVESPVVSGLWADTKIVAVNLYQDETRTVHYERMGGEP